MEDTIKLPKTLLYSHIRRNTIEKPDKPTIYNAAGDYVNYNDIIKIYDESKSFITDIQIKPYERVAIVTKDEISAAMLSVAIVDRAVLLPIDIELPDERIEYYYKLLDADYIITDDLTCSQCGIAKNLGMGIICFKIDDKRSNIEFHIDLPIKKQSVPNKVKTSHYVKLSTTSGTTSTPKIVPKTASQYNAGLTALMDYYEYTSDDNILILTRIYKGYTISTVFRALALGCTIVFAGGFNHADLYNLLKTYKITVFSTVPAIMSSFIKYAEDNDIDFSNLSLRFIQSAGAALSGKLKDYFESAFNTQIVNSYGMTEVGVISTTYNAPKGYKEDSVGLNFLLDVKIADDEILVKGPTVFAGYENSEIDNDEYFTDGWFHTGDTGYVDEDGYIFITGRIKEMINRGGEKVSPYEVESKILKIKNILDAIVFPYPNSYGSENVGTVVVLENGSNLNIRELRKHLTGELPPFKMPKILYTVDEIPKSSNNKVQRKQLYTQLCDKYEVSDLDRDVKPDVKLTDTEKSVIKILRNTLKIKNPDLSDTFTELGGDSMDGAVVLSALEKRFDVRVPVSELFENGTIKSIAGYIDSSKTGNEQFKFLVTVKSSGSKKPLVCVHSGTGDAVTYRHIGKYMDEDRPVYALRFDKKKVEWPIPLEFKDISREYADEIVRLDPDGPHYLCGHCWGGVLAFSIASELARRGNKVSLLAMLDSPMKKQSDSENRSNPGNHIRVGRSVRKSLRDLLKMPLNKMVRYFIRKFSNAGNMLKLKYAGRIYNYGVANNKNIMVRLAGKTGMLTAAYDRYDPLQYNGKIVYFKTTQRSFDSGGPTAYWQKMALGFECIEMDCKHNDIVVGDDAKVLVKKLEELMRASDA